jgi:phosphohistidine swiveling domain-containing protein
MPSTTSSLPARFLPLDAPEVSLETVGGKAFNLVMLTRAGFPVPAGFIIPTDAYQRYVDASDLQPVIEASLEGLAGDLPGRFEAAASAIRQAFLEAEPGPDLAAEIAQAAGWLGADGLAVRSSATAEDLPGASFAGQQATFLNIVGEQALLQAVVECWSSLWTARALAYREKNGIDHRIVSLAVVAQAMVPSSSSGVMFTANPLTGLRSEITIDATYGLGEALVSGQVEPDHYVFNRHSGAVTEKYLGGKAILMRGRAGGGVETIPGESPREQALPDGAIRTLARLGENIEAIFDIPQDIEWAYLPDARGPELATGGTNPGDIYIVQSRPITSLYPLPEGIPLSPPRVFLSFGAVQGITDPLTPLGMDSIRLLMAGGASLFGIQADQNSQGIMYIAGERLWAELTAVLRHPLGARMAPRVFTGVEPGSIPALKAIMADENLGAGSGRIRVASLRRAAGFAIRMMRKVIYWIQRPEGKAALIREDIQARVREFEAQSRPHDGEQVTLRHALNVHHKLYGLFPYAIPEIASVLIAGLLPLVPLSRMSRELTGSQDAALEITRGVAGNVTTEMDLALWRSARAIKADPASLKALSAQSSEELARAFLKGALPAVAQQELGGFLARYGMRGLGEIDIGRPRWSDDPTPIVHTLQSYLLIEEGPQAPDAVFERSARSAEQAIGTLENAARASYAGWLKSRIVRALARRVRSYAGLRESPKFYIVQVLSVVRQLLLEAGGGLASEGTLRQPDDVFHLYIEELEALARGERRNWQGLIEERRESYARETYRKQIPRLLVSDGRAFYEGMLPGEGDHTSLNGSGVSPGVVEGAARIVLDPHQANLQPGEILVCPGTDPSWTPLFLAAGGLVMELGGLMTHGAIIAREYGIPAVVGVDRATGRIQTGDRLRIDGSQGIVCLLDED